MNKTEKPLWNGLSSPPVLPQLLILTEEVTFNQQLGSFERGEMKSFVS